MNMYMEYQPFKGIFPALLTPITEDGRIIKAGLRRLIDWELERGADGFYIGGATGECYSMDTPARQELAQAAIEAVAGRGRTIVHIGAFSVTEGIRLAKQAQDAGAEAISATPPPVYRYSDSEIISYYAMLAGAVRIPMIVYANTMFGDRNLIPVMERLVEIPNVTGVKFTRSSYYELFQLSRLQSGSINLLNGPDETLLCGLLMGAGGGIGSTYNIMPGIYKNIYEAYIRGDMADGRKWQFKVDRIIGVLLKYGQIRAMKYLFERTGILLGKAEKPAAELTEKEKKELLGELKEAGYFEEYPEME